VSCNSYFYIDDSGKFCNQVQCDESLYEVDISGRKCNLKKSESYYYDLLESIGRCSGEFIQQVDQ